MFFDTGRWFARTPESINFCRELRPCGCAQERAQCVTPEEPAANGTQQFKVYVGRLVGNNDRDSSEMWLGVTEQDLQLLVLRTLQKISVATTRGLGIHQHRIRASANPRHFALTLCNFDPDSRDSSHHPCGPRWKRAF